MKKNLPGLLLGTIAVAGMALAVSCVKTDNATCANTAESPVRAVSGADTAKANVADTLIVGFIVTNSCGKMATINPSVATTGTNVHVVTTYEGCVCTPAAFQVNQKYVFKSPNPGTYTLSFWGGGDTAIITKTIVVVP